MLKIKDELRKYNLIPYRYQNVGNVSIVDTSKGKYVFKKNIDNNIFEYLNSRNFNYYPIVISEPSSDYLITKYIKGIDISSEQKIDDMIDLVSLLHNKTTHYKEVDSDSYNEIYEDISNNIEYLYNYYNDLMTIIESKVFMSPSEYMLSLNISKVYERLSYAYNELNRWYKKVKDKKKKRMVLIHNNLRLDHFILDDKPYLISWDKSKLDMPIFDLYKLYKNNESFDFSEALKRYEHEYKLLDYEKELLFILISLPDKIEFNDSNINMCMKISNMINILDRARELTLPNNFEKTKNN
nr:hypothetical protein [Bacilli bacterium]